LLGDSVVCDLVADDILDHSQQNAPPVVKAATAKPKATATKASAKPVAKKVGAKVGFVDFSTPFPPIETAFRKLKSFVLLTYRPPRSQPPRQR
jgi:hypothetical protein